VKRAGSFREFLIEQSGVSGDNRYLHQRGLYPRWKGRVRTCPEETAEMMLFRTVGKRDVSQGMREKKCVTTGGESERVREGDEAWGAGQSKQQENFCLRKRGKQK